MYIPFYLYHLNSTVILETTADIFNNFIHDLSANVGATWNKKCMKLFLDKKENKEKLENEIKFI